MSSKKNRNNPDNNNPPTETQNLSEGSDSSADLAVLKAQADAVDSAAYAADVAEGAAAHAAGDAPGEEGEAAPAGPSLADVLPFARMVIGTVAKEVHDVYPSSRRVLTELQVEIGAERLAPLILKYPVMPEWLLKLYERFKEEFMFGVWVAGVTYGIRKAIIEDERAAAEAKAGQAGEKQSA